MLNLEADGVALAIDEQTGGRLASLCIDDLEILVTDDESLLHWGCYPMAPWASRIRNGHFDFGGRTIELPKRMPPHAIHGTVLDRAWQIEHQTATECILATSLGDAWPWPGSARQRFLLTESSLVCQLEIHAERESFPASLGWHPWFLRQLTRGASAELDFSAGAIYLTDGSDLPTGQTGPPGPGPFDDCFTDVTGDPVIRWSGALEMTLSTDLDHWIVYTLPEHAICVEPVSAPPDVFNLPAPALESDGTSLPKHLVRPGEPLTGEFRWSWKKA